MKLDYLLSIDDVVFMEAFQSEQYVRSVKAREFDFKSKQVRQVEKELATMAVVEHEVQLLAVFECVFHFDDEGMVESLQDAPLSLGVLDLVEFTDDFLLEHFHSVVFLCLLVQHEQNFAVSADAEDFQGCEVFYRCVLGIPSNGLRLHLRDDVLIVLLERLLLFFLVIQSDMCFIFLSLSYGMFDSSIIDGAFGQLLAVLLVYHFDFRCRLSSGR